MTLDLDMKLSEHFTLREFVKSETAQKLEINNLPTLLDIQHLKELCNFLLEPFRQWYGKPVIITSGYRCPALNQAVGGVPTSCHRYGYGADMVPKTGTVDEFALKWKEFLDTHKDIKFDQLLIEKSKRSKWVHIGIRNGASKQRCMILNLEVKDKKAEGTKDNKKEGKSK